MATILIERQINGNTTTSTELISKVNDVDSRRRQQVAGSGVRLPAIARPSHDRQTSPGRMKQAGTASRVGVVDGLIRGESLSSSCPGLEHVAGQRSDARRRFVCVVKTRVLPSLDRRQTDTALSQQPDPASSSKHVWNSPPRRLRRACCQRPPFRQTNSSQSPAATDAVDGDQSRSEMTSFNVREMRRSVSDDALPALRQSCHVDALPPVHKAPWYVSNTEVSNDVCRISTKRSRHRKLRAENIKRNRVVSVLDSGAEGPGSNRSRDAVG